MASSSMHQYVPSVHGIFLKKSLWWWTYFQCLTVTLAPSTTAMYHSVPTWRPRTSPGDLIAKTMFIWLSVYLFWSRKMSRCAVCLLLLHKFEVNVKLRTLIHVHVVAILAGTLPNTWTSTIRRTLLSSASQKEKVCTRLDFFIECPKSIPHFSDCMLAEDTSLFKIQVFSFRQKQWNLAKPYFTGWWEGPLLGVSKNRLHCPAPPPLSNTATSAVVQTQRWWWWCWPSSPPTPPLW